MSCPVGCQGRIGQDRLAESGRRTGGSKGVGHLSVKKKTDGRQRTAAQAKEKARRFGLRLQGVTREGVIILLLAACVFLLLAMFS